MNVTGGYNMQLSGPRFCLLKQSVKSVLKHFGTRKDIDREELEGQLWLKVTEVLPKFEKLDDDDVKPLAFRILKNHTVDFLRKNKTIKHLNCGHEVITSDFTFEDLVDAYSSKLSEVFPQECPMRFQDLAHVIEAYIEYQNPRMKNFLSELVNPSEFTLKKWENLKEKNPTYKQFKDEIPPVTLGKMLGIPSVLVNKTMNDFKHHLMCYGYGVQ